MFSIARMDETYEASELPSQERVTMKLRSGACALWSAQDAILGIRFETSDGLGLQHFIQGLSLGSIIPDRQIQCVLVLRTAMDKELSENDLSHTDALLVTRQTSLLHYADFVSHRCRHAAQLSLLSYCSWSS